MKLNHNLAHQKYFEEITQIPHGSYHEGAIATYIETFALSHQLRVKRDKMNNVIVWKNATKGYEDHEAVLLQAHTDMVCEKCAEIDFDFAKDPLEIFIEGGYIKAKGTTLGADDGVGVAYMLAVLADEHIAHPPLQCIFTVQEEVGLFGALALKPEDIQASRMINLDDGDETSTCIASAGGMNVIMTRTCTFTTMDGNEYCIKVNGLSGGHSGGAIDSEKGNAHKLLARVLKRITKAYELQIADWQGGLMDNAIPREAYVHILTTANDEQMQAIIKEMQDTFYKELEFSDPGVMIMCQKQIVSTVLSKQDSDALLHMMLLMPNGLRHHSMEIKGLSTASSNLAIICIKNAKITINISLRGALESYVDLLADEVDSLADMVGFDYTHEARYPAWSYDTHSSLRETMQSVCKEIYDQELTLVAVHGGLECGVFKALCPNLEIVTMCAIMHDIHTPQERLQLKSFDQTYTFLTSLLKQL